MAANPDETQQTGISQAGASQ
ncbi:MAG: hypothetical protein JWP93_2303, partial [Polaromonas sp.]|nr:hypothetical protein [Polaromonas sp.]